MINKVIGALSLPLFFALAYLISNGTRYFKTDISEASELVKVILIGFVAMPIAAFAIGYFPHNLKPSFYLNIWRYEMQHAGKWAAKKKLN